MWSDTSLFLFFMVGFLTTVYIYTRSMNASLRRQRVLVAKKEYERRKKVARITGRFNDFEIIPEFEEKE